MGAAPAILTRYMVMELYIKFINKTFKSALSYLICVE
jgi:hypothetical protein